MRFNLLLHDFLTCDNCHTTGYWSKMDSWIILDRRKLWVLIFYRIKELIVFM